MPRMHIFNTVDAVFQGRLASYASQGRPIIPSGWLRWGCASPTLHDLL